MLAALLAAAAGLRAEEARDGGDVWRRLAAQTQATGSFRQALYSEEGELLERSSGRYAVLRPGYFRWIIEAPDRQQIIVAGDSLWHYDLDLATATQRRIDDETQFPALDLLARDSDELVERFRVEALGDDRYRLTPLFPQAGFSVAELTWEGDRLVAMDVIDRSGQALQLLLDPDRDAASLSPADFAFEPPAGTDVQRLPES